MGTARCVGKLAIPKRVYCKDASLFTTLQPTNGFHIQSPRLQKPPIHAIPQVAARLVSGFLRPFSSRCANRCPELTAGSCPASPASSIEAPRPAILSCREGV